MTQPDRCPACRLEWDDPNALFVCSKSAYHGVEPWEDGNMGLTQPDPPKMGLWAEMAYSIHRLEELSTQARAAYEGIDPDELERVARNVEICGADIYGLVNEIQEGGTP